MLMIAFCVRPAWARASIDISCASERPPAAMPPTLRKPRRVRLPSPGLPKSVIIYLYNTWVIAEVDPPRNSDYSDSGWAVWEVWYDVHLYPRPPPLRLPGRLPGPLHP